MGKHISSVLASITHSWEISHVCFKALIQLKRIYPSDFNQPALSCHINNRQLSWMNSKGLVFKIQQMKIPVEPMLTKPWLQHFIVSGCVSRKHSWMLFYERRREGGREIWQAELKTTPPHQEEHGQLSGTLTLGWLKRGREAGPQTFWEKAITRLTS